jgi:hypothetical protein
MRSAGLECRDPGIAHADSCDSYVLDPGPPHLSLFRGSGTFIVVRQSNVSRRLCDALIHPLFCRKLFAITIARCLHPRLGLAFASRGRRGTGHLLVFKARRLRLGLRMLNRGLARRGIWVVPARGDILLAVCRDQQG